MKARIKRVLSGKLKGQFRLILVARNGEPIMDSRETYTQKKNITKLVKKYFPEFEIEYLS